MSEMSLRIEAALAEVIADRGDKPLASAFGLFLADHKGELARAAIKAMREPTKAMQAAAERDEEIQCGLDDCNKHDIPDKAWRLMIDEALK